MYNTGNVTGLPIGNYSSQFFANVYLDRLDQFVKHELRQRFYLRYVDDLLLLDRDRDRLVACGEHIGAFLRRELNLELNPNARVLAPTTNGIDALGYVIHRNHRLLRRRTVRRFEQRLRQTRASIVHPMADSNAIHPNTQDGDQLLARCMSYRGLLLHAQSSRLIDRLQREHQWVGWLWWLGPRGRVHRRYDVYTPPHSLSAQWRQTKSLWPNARIVMQVGNFWEAFGRDSDWLRAQLGLGCGRTRRGFSAGAGFPCADDARFEWLVNHSNDSIVVWKQRDGYQGAVHGRTLAVAVLQPGAVLPNMGKWLSPYSIQPRSDGAMSLVRSGVLGTRETLSVLQLQERGYTIETWVLGTRETLSVLQHGRVKLVGTLQLEMDI